MPTKPKAEVRVGDRFLSVWGLVEVTEVKGEVIAGRLPTGRVCTFTRDQFFEPFSAEPETGRQRLWGGSR